MFDHLKADFRRLRGLGYQGSYFRAILENQALWAIICYRAGRHLVEHPLPFLLRKIVGVFYHFWWMSVQMSTGIYLSPTAKIGPGLYIGHFGQVFVGMDCELGSNCNLSQEVTVGLAKRGGEWGTPTIGDRVYLAPGCKVVGPIRLANGTVVGANAVMSRDSTENSVWAGIPARVIAHTGSREYLGEIDFDWDAEEAARAEREAREKDDDAARDSAAPPA